MKPPRFEYLAPTSLDEALGLLADHGDEAKILAGGQSLLPLLNFRLVRPAYLVDINPISSLDFIRVENEYLSIGALTRHVAIESAHVLPGPWHAPREGARLIGHHPNR